MSLKVRTLEEALDAFIEEKEARWTDPEWADLLRQIEDMGLPAHGEEARQIGLMLEERRLRYVLRSTGVRGVGPRRVEALVAAFGNLWQMRIAELPTVVAAGIPEKLARSVLEEVNSRPL